MLSFAPHGGISGGVLGRACRVWVSVLLPNGEGAIRSRPLCLMLQNKIFAANFLLREIMFTIRYYSNATAAPFVTPENETVCRIVPQNG